MTLKKEITEQIRELLRENQNGLSITAITRRIGVNRNTAGRYLENLMVSGQVEMRHFGMAKIYRLAQRVPLSAMLSITSELIMLLDNSSRVIYANEPMLSFLTTTQKDLYGRNVEFTPCVTIFNDAFDLLKKKIRGAVEGKEWSGEISVRNGAVIFACRIAPTVFEEGQRGASVILEDVTIRRKAEEAIRNSELEFRMLAENAFDIINRHSPDGTCLYVSPAIKTISGFGPAEIVGHRGSEFIHPDDILRTEETCRQMTPDHPSVTIAYRCRHRDGHYLWVESSFRAVFEESTGQISGVYGVTRDISARIAAEDAMRESEEKYRLLSEASRDLIYLIGPDDRVLYVNSHAAALVQKPTSEITGMPRSSLFPKIVADRQGADLRQVFATGVPVRREGPMLVDGQIRWFDHYLTPVADAGNNVTAVMGVSRDITERRCVQEALRESEATARALINTPTDSVFLLDVNGIILDANETAARVLGQMREDMIGMPADNLVRPDIAKRRRDLILKMLETKKQVRFEDCRDGIWFDTVAFPILDGSGEISKIAIIARNITERKNTDAALIRSRERFRDLVTTLPDIVWETDAQARFVYVSPQVEQILGYRPEDLIGRTPYEYLDPAGIAENREAFAAVIRNKGNFISHNSVWLHKDGHRVVLETRGRPVYGADGSFAGFRGIDRDITAQVRATEALHRSEQRFRELADLLPQNVWECDIDGKLTFANRGSFAMYGYMPEDFEAGLYIWQMIHPCDRQRVMDDFTEALNHVPAEFPDQHEYTALRKDGSTFPIITYHVPVVQGTTITGMRGIGIDLTERKQMEEALQDVVRAFRMLAENSVDIISRIRPDGTCAYISPAVRRSLGYEPEDLVGRHGSECTHPDDHSRMIESMRAFETGGRDTGTVEYRMRHKDGSYVRFEATIRATRDEKTGNVSEFTVVSRSVGKCEGT